MKCPNCGSPEKAQVKVCWSCGEVYASQDLLELHQLEFLLEETAAWGAVETLRAPYAERLASLRARLERRTPAQPEAVVEAVPTPTPEPPTAPRPAPSPPREKVPFDQWLLSERNIKIALYSGGLLLVLAGLIFIGVNWTRIPGPGKFAITLMVTGLMYLGGYLLFQRPAYRLGGVALLGVASGFLTLNFAVLQIYVLGPQGLRNDVMWLIASPLCLLLYVLTVYWTRSDLLTYISLAAVVSTVTAALVVIDAPLLVFVLAYSLLMWAILLVARAFQSTTLADFTRLPMLIVSHVGTPLVLVAAVVGWISTTGHMYGSGNPWLALLALGVGVLFYATTDAIFKWPAARWVVAILFPVAFSFVLVELDFSDTAAGITLMAMALAYLGVGYVLEQREGRRAGGWPFYAMAYVVAAFVTLQAIPETDDLARVLAGDVVLLAISAAIHRDYRWVYGAVWLFMLPVYLFISMSVTALYNQGLLMGVLGLNYVAAGYALGRRKLGLGGPFLTAAAFLSIVVVALTWNNPIVASLALASVAVLYLMAALWLGWPWLLLPALLAVNLDVFVVNDMFFESLAALERALTISYSTLGAALALGGLGLRVGARATAGANHAHASRTWAWPLDLTGAVDLVGAYLAGLVIGGWLAIGLSAVLAVLLLTLAWLERATFVERKLPPMLAYLGIGAIFIGHFCVIDTIGRGYAWDVWPGYTSALCALFVALAWLLRRGPLTDVYATPLRRAGLWLMAIPMAGSVFIGVFYWEPLLIAVTFAIAGVTYAGDAALRRILGLAYLGVGAFVVVIWAVLMALDVSEPQAYVIPLGLALLGVGWNERLRGRNTSYRWLTLSGLIVLTGSAFVQSLPRCAYGYALLFGIESLVMLGWGIHTHSRGYVQLGGLALIANAIVQFGPSFIELPRWIQLGVTGSILLGGGIAALFKREEILATRRRLMEKWGEWEA
jgi:hypothetical protein